MPCFPGDSAEAAEVLTIDWYDGVVTGLVRYRGMSQWHYVSLLAWSQEFEERVYALVPVPQDTARRLRTLISKAPEPATQDHWNSIQEEVSRMKREWGGKIRLIRCRALDRPVLASAEVDVDDLELRSHLGQDVELAIREDAIEQWFSLEKLQP